MPAPSRDKTRRKVEWAEWYADPVNKAAYLATRRAGYARDIDKQRARSKEKAKSPRGKAQALAGTRRYYARHRDELAKRRTTQAYKAKQNAYHRAWYAANRDRRLAQTKEWQSANRERFEKAKDKYKNTPQGKRSFKKALDKYRRSNLLKFAEMAARRRSWKLETEVEKIDFAAVLKSADGLCQICKKPFDLFGIHFDHIKPLSKGGTHTQDNIQATHASCNMKKGAKYAGI